MDDRNRALVELATRALALGKIRETDSSDRDCVVTNAEFNVIEAADAYYAACVAHRPVPDAPIERIVIQLPAMKPQFLQRSSNEGEP